jgi:hypothetical protein
MTANKDIDRAWWASESQSWTVAAELVRRSCSTLGMPDRTAALNARQLDVLNWVADGSPPEVMEGHSHKRTAIALQDRRLVKVSRKGGVWSASLTEAGRHYVEHGRYPEGLWASVAESLVAAPVAPPKEPSRRAVAAARRTARAEQPPMPTPPTDRLMQDLVAAGGILTVDHDSERFKNLVSSAIQYGKIPSGKQVETYSGRTWSELVIRLHDAPEWVAPPDVSIPVPAVVRRPHPVVASLRDRDEITGLTKAVRSRAVRILDTIATEAQARGYLVTAGRVAQRWERRSWGDSLLNVEVRGQTVGIEIRQENDRTPHTPTVTELRKKERSSWFDIPIHDVTPSERLKIGLVGGRPYGRSEWKDGKRVTIDDAVGAMLREVEIRAAFGEWADIKKEFDASERERQRQAAMARAKRTLIEDHRAKTLLSRPAAGGRTYC